MEVFYSLFAENRANHAFRKADPFVLCAERVKRLAKTVPKANAFVLSTERVKNIKKVKCLRPARGEGK
jgi:hypothetical protein